MSAPAWIKCSERLPEATQMVWRYNGLSVLNPVEGQWLRDRYKALSGLCWLPAEMPQPPAAEVSLEQEDKEAWESWIMRRSYGSGEKDTFIAGCESGRTRERADVARLLVDGRTTSAKLGDLRRRVGLDKEGV